MRYLRLATVALVALAAMAFAQADDPTVELQIPDKVKPGQTVKATVVITFSPGWHGYQNPPTKDYMIPVSVASGKKTVKFSKISYPKGSMASAPGESGKIAVYQGTVRIAVTFTAPKTEGYLTVPIKVNYQQCDENACLPPDSITASKKIQITKKA